MMIKQIIRQSNNLGKILDKLFLAFCNLLQMMLVGCLHRRMGKPLTVGGATYRICADCGAYRLYDLEKMRFRGGYFYRLPESAAQPRPIAGSLLGGQIGQAV